MDKRKVSSGGARKGAGRPKKLNDPVTLGFRIEREDKEKLTNKYGKNLSTLFHKWIKKLIENG